MPDFVEKKKKILLLLLLRERERERENVPMFHVLMNVGEKGCRFF